MPLDTVERRKISYPYLESNYDFSAIQLEIQQFLIYYYNIKREFGDAVPFLNLGAHREDVLNSKGA
jgi:hypothetical protein